MTPLEKLQALGFQVEAIPDQRRKGVTVYKIRTADGWVYERFTSADEVTAWAAKRNPAAS